MSVTEKAWRKLADHLNLFRRLRNGEAVKLDSKTIKQVTGREPRLMVKFDSREQRPGLLKHVTILPIANGEWVIVAGDGYYEIEEVDKAPQTWKLPTKAARLKTLPWDSGPASESQMLDMALACGMLDAFLEEASVTLTIRGRLRTLDFSYDFAIPDGTVKVDVSGVQVEVDAGLEGEEIYLVEAKLGGRTNFIMRQLYYPVRMWSERVPDKPISAVFANHSDKVFSFRQYVFDPLNYYHSAKLVRAADYTLDYVRLDLSLANILEGAKPESLPKGIPFPQADDITKVIDVIDAVAAGISSTEDVAELYDFDPRQADYYRNASQFLGFIKRDKRSFQLTEFGRAFSTASRDKRHELILIRMASLPVFRQAIEWLERNHAIPSANLIAEWIEENTKYTGTTPRRRASTVVSWLKWVHNTVNGIKFST